MKRIAWIGMAAWLALLSGCSDNSGGTAASSESRQLLQQFGDLQSHFTEAGMQGLLDYEDSGRPVTLVQLMSVTDGEAYARYEAQAAALWQSVGARERFRSEVFDQLLGNRPLDQARLIEFPNILLLRSTVNSPAFTDLMNTLATASDDHAWVLGEELPLPFEPEGSYFDPALQGLDADAALALLAGVDRDGQGDASNLQSNVDTLVDMVVSDAPGPFWMVNLIDFYDKANFPDGRETALSGEEANAMYSDAILPTLLRYHSLPEFVMPVSVILTDEEVEWEQVAIPRYASRDAFLNAFPLNPEASDALVYKEAGVENTLVYASEVPGTVVPAPENGPLFNYRYCEVLLFHEGDAGLRADVYNSMLLNTCPGELWAALDAEQIASENGAQLAALNGIRFWVLDLIASELPPGPPVLSDFGGIQMRLAASVELAPGSFIGGEPPAYQINRVSRDTVFHYVAGRQVYELQNPDGTRYRMQSFTQGVAPDQQLVDLQRLGQRLELPQGWTFHVRLLEENSPITTVDGIAEVITDDLGNTYQRVPD